MKLVIQLPRAADADLAADLAKQAVYATPGVRAARVTPDGTALEVELAADDLAAGEKLRRFAERMTARHRPLARKELFRRPRRDDGPIADPHDELRRRGWIRELGRGQVALAGGALALYQAVDAEVGAAARTRFDAPEEQYPSLMPAEILARCGYFTSFPHSVTMAVHLTEDLDLIERFRAANEATTRPVFPDAAAVAPVEACLRPAVCYHGWVAMSGEALPRGGRAVTSSGRCFRWESSNLEGLDRLWDFGMREIFFAGAAADVATRRAGALDLLRAQLEALDLACVVETASDPFFVSTYAEKTYWQVRGDLKYEARLALPGGRTVAAASFNLHDDFFGRTFAIADAAGTPAHTGCAAWGLERWVLAAFAQHGFDPARWPAPWRDVVR